MICDIVKQAIPSAISETGGARVQIVGKNTIPLQTSVKEAKDGLYVLGDEQLIRGEFQGLFKSMAAGVARDGHSRQIGDFLTVYAQPEGPVDLEKGWDPAVNRFRIKARLLNEMVLDITDWAFRDVTPGRTPFKLVSASTGSISDVVETGKAVHINGNDLPAVTDVKVEWVVEGTEKSGTVPAASLTGDCDRLNIAASALAEIASATYDGKTIAFTVRGNYANATIRATLKYVAPTGPTLTRIEDEEGHVGPTIDAGHEQDFLIGTNLAETTSVSMAGQKAVGTRYTLPCTIKAKTATKLTINIPTDEFDMEQNPVTFTVTTPAGTAEISAIMVV